MQSQPRPRQRRDPTPPAAHLALDDAPAHRRVGPQDIPAPKKKRTVGFSSKLAHHIGDSQRDLSQPPHPPPQTTSTTTATTTRHRHDEMVRLPNRTPPKNSRLSRDFSIANPYLDPNTTMTPPSASRSAPTVVATPSTTGSPRDARRERTLIGTECAACDEPLEHTLRGEKVVQLVCGHVAHEACLYEYIGELGGIDCPTCEARLELDTSKGAGADFDLNSLVRSVQNPPPPSAALARDLQSTPLPSQARRSLSRTSQPFKILHSAYSPSQYTRQSGEFQLSRPAQHPLHRRSCDAAVLEHDVHADPHQYMASAMTRRNDMDDARSVDTKDAPPKNSVPPPIITLRSEYPTVNKSRQQQSLTCLVTVEAADTMWQPEKDDLRATSAAPPLVPAPLNPHKPDPQQPSKKRLSSRPNSAAPPADGRDDQDVLNDVKEELIRRVDNWHGLDFTRFGSLVLYGTMKVGKDRQTWQDLECYLFTEMLICVKEKKNGANTSQKRVSMEGVPSRSRCTLKGSILIKKHLEDVDYVPGNSILTLRLSVAELSTFHLAFQDRIQMNVWRRTLLNIRHLQLADPNPSDLARATAGSDGDDDDRASITNKADGTTSSVVSSNHGASRSQATAPTEYTGSHAGAQDHLSLPSFHVPVDVVVAISISSSTQGLKLSLLRDTLKFLVANLGERDRLGLVTFGHGAGATTVVDMAPKGWLGWSRAINAIRPTEQMNVWAGVVEGANAAMDVLMQRKSTNPVSSILLISDLPNSDHDSVSFVASRAEAAKIGIYCFGLGLTHRPDTLVELSTRTKASYVYVKDWMMLRDCVAGGLGSLQSTSHQNVKLRLRLPEGSPAKFVKITGGLQVTKRATGNDADVSLGDLRFGDKRDILVQLAIAHDPAVPENTLPDPWDTIISGLEALSGPYDTDDSLRQSVDEVPLIQADLVWGDILRDGSDAKLPNPSLLAITMLPKSRKDRSSRPNSPPIPAHPAIVQRRMEMLTSDMLSRALSLIGKGQHDRASNLLTETRSILNGLTKGGLPPPPLPPVPSNGSHKSSPKENGTPVEAKVPLPPDSATFPTTSPPPSPPRQLERVNAAFAPSAVAGLDPQVMTALDTELLTAVEWISHPAQFARDSRKAVLQAIGIVGSQRAYSFRTPAEQLWAVRTPGIRKLAERSREWREAGSESLMEEP